MQKAIFLDRDGVMIEERGDYTWLEENVEINEGIVEALEKLKNRGYIFVVITNQSGIAKKLYKHAHVQEVHATLKEFFAEEGIQIKEFYYCPHHPSVTKCLCRKPDSLLLEKAIARFNIDPALSYFIGDMPRDAAAGTAAGVMPILIPANANPRTYLHLIP